MDTKELVDKAKKNNKEALVRLIMDKKEEYYKLAYVYVRNPDDAMDMLQEMIIIVYENLTKLKKNESFYSWSKTILVNCCRNHLKMSRKYIVDNEIRQDTSYHDDMSVTDNIFIEEKISKLKIKYQEVIKMKYYMDMDYLSISKLLGIPVGTVKSRLNTAIKKLRESIGGEILNG